MGVRGEELRWFFSARRRRARPGGSDQALATCAVGRPLAEMSGADISDAVRPGPAMPAFDNRLIRQGLDTVIQPLLLEDTHMF